MVRHHTNGAKSGFTMFEMLTVLAIIFVLLGFLLTSITQARRAGNTVVCAQDLHVLFTAFQARAIDLPDRDITVNGWSAELYSYVPKDSNSFICPESDVYSDSTGGIAQIAVRCNVGGRVHDVPLAPGPYAVKKNDSGYYYELWVEDILGGGDRDFNDVVLGLQFYPDRIEVTDMPHGGVSYRNDLVNVTTNQILIQDCKSMVGTKVTISATSALSNFGINVNANITRNKAEKVLLTDYYKIVAQPTDDTTPTTTNKMIYRHPGQVANVVMGDGSVQQTRSGQIEW